jgi:hypothetical protein
MENGGYITIYDTPLQFTVQTLTRNGSAPSPYSDFNVFGATGATGSTGGAGGTGGGGTQALRAPARAVAVSPATTAGPDRVVRLVRTVPPALRDRRGCQACQRRSPSMA